MSKRYISKRYIPSENAKKLIETTFDSWDEEEKIVTKEEMQVRNEPQPKEVVLNIALSPKPERHLKNSRENERKKKTTGTKWDYVNYTIFFVAVVMVVVTLWIIWPEHTPDVGKYVMPTVDKFATMANNTNHFVFSFFSKEEKKVIEEVIEIPKESPPSVFGAIINTAKNPIVVEVATTAFVGVGFGGILLNVFG